MFLFDSQWITEKIQFVRIRILEEFWNDDRQRPKLFHNCINTNWMSNVLMVGCKCSLLCKNSMAVFSNLSISSLFTIKHWLDGFPDGKMLNTLRRRQIETLTLTFAFDWNGGKSDTHDLHLQSNWKSRIRITLRSTGFLENKINYITTKLCA